MIFNTKLGPSKYWVGAALATLVIVFSMGHANAGDTKKPTRDSSHQKSNGQTESEADFAARLLSGNLGSSEDEQGKGIDDGPQDLARRLENGDLSAGNGEGSQTLTTIANQKQAEEDQARRDALSAIAKSAATMPSIVIPDFIANPK
ncbi:hypothetical protein [Mesorhizobium sp. BH1-1-4]|uniref:hypothetical protein n=1 Tax=Mesorhizobium sp. BH1-1-4 TaxID=2876662 RepID=UPI001CD0D8F3|nr:hypothetical protein [Mesorhizobium sp. BH1-1-4]MBZ9994037.1 hypothetical protein [Mesorhizobium sp. BH1-1-4]